jgi:hypothetical protein
MAAKEAELGIPERTLYIKGRVAAVGDVSQRVAQSLYGIFPDYYVSFGYRRAAALSAADALAAYIDVCSSWGESEFSHEEVSACEELAHALRTVVACTDASGLALFGAWQSVAVELTSPRAAAAFELMRVRELRGGLHFAALRAEGLAVSRALMADRIDGGYDRLLRSGWTRKDAGRLRDDYESAPAVQDSWDRAEERTGRVFGAALRAALGDEKSEALVDQLVALSVRHPHLTSPTTALQEGDPA